MVKLFKAIKSPDKQRKNTAEVNRRSQDNFRVNNPDKAATVAIRLYNGKATKDRFDKLKDDLNLDSNGFLDRLLNEFENNLKA